MELIHQYEQKYCYTLPVFWRPFKSKSKFISHRDISEHIYDPKKFICDFMHILNFFLLNNIYSSHISSTKYYHLKDTDIYLDISDKYSIKSHDKFIKHFVKSLLMILQYIDVDVSKIKQIASINDINHLFGFNVIEFNLKVSYDVSQLLISISDTESYQFNCYQDVSIYLSYPLNNTSETQECLICYNLIYLNQFQLLCCHKYM